MDTQQRSAYDATRDFSDKGFRAGCYAPFTSMYLDPAGDVRACCQNVGHVLGNVGRESLLGIWRGERAEQLRAAMVDYDMGLGCRFCQWQFDDGNFGAALAHDFEGLAVVAPEAGWPQRLELAISNTCNLECVMCDGDLSSRIRAHREHRPRLPRVYDDRFFSDLAAFLPHLVEVRFLGDAWGCRVSVNTVIRDPFALYQLPLPEFEAMVAALEKQARKLRRRLSLNLDVWDAEIDRLRHWRDQSRAEVALRAEREVTATIRRRTTYFQPAPAPRAPAAACVGAVPGADARSSDHEVPGEVESRPDPRISSRVEPLTPALSESAGAPEITPAAASALAAEGMATPRTTFLVCDPDDRAVEVGPGSEFAGIPVERCLGSSYVDVVAEVSSHLGEPVLIDEQHGADHLVRRIRFDPRDGRTTYVQVVAVPVPWEGGSERSGSLTVAAASTTAPVWGGPPPGCRDRRRYPRVREREDRGRGPVEPAAVVRGGGSSHTIDRAGSNRTALGRCHHVLVEDNTVNRTYLTGSGNVDPFSYEGVFVEDSTDVTLRLRPGRGGDGRRSGPVGRGRSGRRRAAT